VADVKSAMEMRELPEFLYHGTDCKNVESICDRGILPGNWKTCNPYTKKTTLGQSFVQDCLGNVSMAKKERDAIFFVVANRETREEHLLPQCIFKIRTSMLPQERLMFRDLFSTKNGEAKLVGNRIVQPEAIEGYKMRTFSEGKKGLKVTEEFRRCKVNGH
jgi:hypothetical protein